MTRPLLLIAHPDPAVLSMLGSMLRSLNCETIEAADEDGLLSGLAREPGLVLLGVDPLKPDALGLFSVIRREHHECPVVLLFSAPHPGLASRANRMGASVLRFPLPANQLRAAVVQALGRGVGPASTSPADRQDEPAGRLIPAPGTASLRAGGPRRPRPRAPCHVRPAPADEVPIQSLKEALEGPERVIILRTLEALGWSLRKTAKALDINRLTLYKKMKKYGICENREVSAFDGGPPGRRGSPGTTPGSRRPRIGLS